MAFFPSRAAYLQVLIVGIFRLASFGRLALKEGRVADAANVLLSQAFHFARSIESMHLVRVLRRRVDI